MSEAWREWENVKIGGRMGWKMDGRREAKCKISKEERFEGVNERDRGTKNVS